MGLVHYGILNVLPNVELVALCEKNSLIRRFARKLFRSLSVVDDLTKLQEFDLDAVYVTTPIPSHFTVAKAILEDNLSRNLFVEKTLAQTSEEAASLVNLARLHQSVTMVGYLRRFCVTFIKTKELLQEDAIGKAESFQAYAYSSDFFGMERGIKASSSRGGVLRDLGCHAVDLALWFFDDLDVDGTGINQGREDLISFKVRGSTVKGEFDVSWCKESYHLPEVGFWVSGPKGKLFVNDDQVRLVRPNGETLQWYRHDLNDTVQFWLGLPEYYREDLHFVKSLRGEAEANPDFSAGAKVDKIIEDAIS